MVKETIARFGRVDVLHNNHAWLMDNMPNDRTVVDTPFEVWDRTMAVNLRGYFAAAKYAVPHMIAQGGGSVINMSSDSGLRSDTAHISYGVSKAAIRSEEHTSELQSLMRISYAVVCLKKKKSKQNQ